MTTGARDKVMIYSFTDKLLTKPNAEIPQPFYLPVNPENFDKNHKIEMDTRRGHGNQGTDPRYNSTKPEELKLEFIFDGTGTIENYRFTDAAKRTVKQQLELFMQTVYDMQGKIHRPNFLKICWGQNLTFNCVISNITVTNQLFDNAGDPLRVKISTTFLRFIPQEERVARERRSSPDLTHIRTVKAGERLDLLTNAIYNDTKYLLQVARANGLVSLRSLKPGLVINFPPIEKTE
jgi:Contractile injection system tube protein